MKSQRLSKHTHNSIPSDWIATCKTIEERKGLIEAVQNDTVVMGRLKEILQAKYDSLQGMSQTLDFVDSAWPYKQAHIQGQMAMLEAIFKLLP